MIVEFIKDFMSYKKGHVLETSETMAKALIKGGYAVKYEAKIS